MRFSSEIRDKVTLLWNTKLRSLVLDHVRSNYDLTLREELLTRFVRTEEEEAKLSKHLLKKENVLKLKNADREGFLRKKRADNRLYFQRKREKIRIEAEGSLNNLTEQYMPQEPQYSRVNSTLQTITFCGSQPSISLLASTSVTQVEQVNFAPSSPIHIPQPNFDDRFDGQDFF